MAKILGKKVLNFLPILLVLLLAAFLRLPTFCLSHGNYDEQAYLSLALKLDRFGFRDFTANYSLHNIDILSVSIRNQKGSFQGPFLSNRSEGNILLNSGVDYESGIPNHRPPLFSYLLHLSHKLLTRYFPYIVAAQTLEQAAIISPQFYAAVIPFMASLLLIFSVYILGCRLFSQKIGLYAALFLALTPIDIMVSQKLWAGDALSLFCTLSMLFYWLSIKKDSLTLAILAGLSAGLAILTKMSGLFILIVIIFFHILSTRRDWSCFKLKSLFLNKKLIALSISALLVSSLWLFIYYTRICSLKTLGIPLAPPQQITAWQEFIGNRPFYVHLVNIPYQFPIYILLYLAPFFFLREKEKQSALTFLFIWYLIPLLILSFLIHGKEGRHMLICYPAISILSSYVLVRLTGFLEQRLFKGSGRIAEIAIISLSAAWALKLVFPVVFLRGNALPFPF